MLYCSTTSGKETGISTGSVVVDLIYKGIKTERRYEIMKDTGTGDIRINLEGDSISG
jgi:hypothetical protein